MQAPALRRMCACALLCASAVAPADQAAQVQRKWFEARAWQPAGDALLDRVRGGFDIAAAWRSRSALCAVSASMASWFRRSSSPCPIWPTSARDQAKEVRDALSQARLIQNGAGNSVGAGVVNTPGATVVQNSLNNQAIQSLTVIDTGANSLGVLRSLNLQGVLRDALLGALGAR